MGGGSHWQADFGSACSGERGGWGREVLERRYAALPRPLDSLLDTGRMHGEARDAARWPSAVQGTHPEPGEEGVQGSADGGGPGLQGLGRDGARDGRDDAHPEKAVGGCRRA